MRHGGSRLSRPTPVATVAGMPDSGTPRFFADLISWYALEALAFGDALGLRSALLQGPGTPAEIALRADADPRTTATWLAAMVAAGYAKHDTGVFRVDPDQVAFLDGSFPAVDTLALLDFVRAMGARVPAVLDVLRSGSAPDHDLFGAEFGEAVGRVNAPLYAGALVTDWLAADDEVTTRLEAGTTVVDLGCGSGAATRVMAEAFPTSTFIGVDRDAAALDRARRTAPGNVSFATAPPASYQVVTILDSFHHFADPDAVLAQIRAALPPGGVMVIAESSYEGDIDVDTADPFSVIGLASALLYCDVEARSPSGTNQIAPQDGGVALRRALAAAGFSTITTHEGTGGYRVYFAR